MRFFSRESISAIELETLLAARLSGTISFALIDAREKYEHLHHYIEGTDEVLHASRFYPKVKTLKDKELAYILYCSNGARSAQCAQIMRELGYKRVVNLAGGIDGYGGKVVKNQIG
ncbi:MAG: rhodanese-like domain-containing protein [Helicobacteraceae bacterium]|jgi:rhodanese-related sulfurtransferase|nr:rhodanese-like domain-containing protein [Helicobacteraceae bacterium]